ncbi:unnamed protein product [Clonostachys solani]|uniref:Uncharacterized protein n=1 Tax=Clonostachys solani TaxID=160281 RepID=A0A9N9Z4D6_9HYPO|nr:unnamed protein product [Clonostachys solani]
MGPASGAAPLRRGKRKAIYLTDEDDTLVVAPPKQLHASITWDVRAKDMAHHMFCTKFVAIMDTAIESQKWDVDIQKKCMELMGELRIDGLYLIGTTKHELAKMFTYDPCFIRIMMLKVLFSPERIKSCDFLERAVPPKYPGWDYTKDLYPPLQYPTGQHAEKELEAIRESIQGVANWKMLPQQKAPPRRERRPEKWIDQPLGKIKIETTFDFEEETRGSTRKHQITG